MGKAKSFAEKMLKSKKPREEFDSFKVIKAKTTQKGSIRYDTLMIKVKKGDNEIKALGI